ncbi:hypothetical protein Chor_012644 [Crotalus horridus]
MYSTNIPKASEDIQMAALGTSLLSATLPNFSTLRVKAHEIPPKEVVLSESFCLKDPITSGTGCVIATKMGIGNLVFILNTAGQENFGAMLEQFLLVYAVNDLGSVFTRSAKRLLICGLWAADCEA